MKDRIRILFVLPSMRGGGAERVIATLLNHMDLERFEPILCLLQKEGPYLDELRDAVQIIDLQAPRVRYAVKKLMDLIRFVKPDIVFSTLGHLNLAISMFRFLLPRRILFIARESNTVSLQNKSEKYAFLYDALYRMFYNGFDLIVAQSSYMKQDLVDNFKMPSEKIRVIYNPVDIRAIQEKIVRDAAPPKTASLNLLAVGRYSEQKGFDLLLKSLSLVQTDVHLKILGDGPLRDALQQQVKTLGLESRVSLLGFQKNPYQYMAEADYLILSSRYEGFPNVVLEAHVCGLPTIVFGCPGGTSEIVLDNVNGIVVECQNVEALASVIDRRPRFDPGELFASVASRFDAGRIVREYEQTFTELYEKESA